MTQDLLTSLGYLALGSRMRRLTEMMWRDVARIYQQHEIEFEPRWFPVYYLLSNGQAMTISEIARELDYSHPAVVQIANAMEKKKLISSARQDGDRRTRALTLTKQGKELLQKIQPVWDEIRAVVEETCASASADFLPTLARLEAANAEESLLARAERRRQQLLNDEVRIVEFDTTSPAHAAAFAKLNEEWLTKYFVIEPHDREMLGNPLGYIIKPGGQIFLAVWDNEIVGACAMIPAPDCEFELAKMAVTERAQGRQIGKRLGEACLDWARAKGVQAVWLESNSRLTTALNLYRKLGFHFEEHPFKSEYARADVYMRMAL